MLEALTGFVVITFAIAVGYALGRSRVFDADLPRALGQLAFLALAPCLLFETMVRADVGTLVSAILPISTLAAAGTFAIYAAIASLRWRRSLPEAVIGGLAAGYVNSNYIGLPIATYILRDPTTVAPIILIQLAVFTPISLALLDAANLRTRGTAKLLAATATNPLLVASLAGLSVALAGVGVPSIVLEPIEAVGAGAVPVILIAFGMSLARQRLLAAADHRRDTIVASGLKLVAMPTIAWLLGRILGLGSTTLAAVTILAALPTAQNVFLFAQRSSGSAGETVARDVIAITTLGSIPIVCGLGLLLIGPPNR